MKILWLDINSSFSHSSLAIPALDAQLESSLRSKAVWEIVSGTIKMESNYFVEEIERFAPQLILSTVWLFNHNMVMETLAKVSALSPHRRVVLGGPQFLGENRDYFQRYPFIDALFRGEGEEIFPKFIERLLLYPFYKAIELEGFCYLTKDGIYHDKGSAQVAFFNKLKWPEESSLFNWDKPFLQIETSRGCFNRCSFCVSGTSRSIEELSPDIVKGRIEEMVKKGVKEIRILDRTFNANSKRAAELIDIFSQYRGEVEFHLEIHPALIDSHLEKALNRAPIGALHIEVGVQSFREEVLAACKRAGNMEQTVRGVKILCKNGRFIIHTDLLIAIPLYSYQEMVEDLAKMFELYPHEIQLESLKILPGTTLQQEHLKYGIKYNPLPPYQVLESSHISLSEIIRGELISKVIDHYYNPFHFREFFRRATLLHPALLEELVDFYQDRDIPISIGVERRALNLWEFVSSHYPSLIEDLAVRWMELGLSYRDREGAGFLSRSWKPGDTLHNPIYSKEKGVTTRYRYLKFKNRIHWFQYDRAKGSSRAALHFIALC